VTDPSAPAAPAPPRRGFIGPFGVRQILIGLAVTVGAAVLLVAVTSPLGSATPGGPRDPQATPYVIGPAVEGLKPGSQAPELFVTHADGTVFQLTDLDGQPVRLADLRGKAVWVNFWASWCSPCQQETPVLRDVAAEFKDRGLVVIGIAVQETTVDDIRAYAQRYQLGYRVAFDAFGDIFHAYRSYALPTHVFIDANGAVQGTVRRPLTLTEARALVEQILPGASSAPPASPSPG
jgi:peroxiredoxin